MHARPNINGNTRADFERAHNNLTVAYVALSTALKDLRMDVLHGRNYQHLPPDEARAHLEEDLCTLTPLVVAMKQIERIQNDMVPAIVS
jgi:hypothetical protein